MIIRRADITKDFDQIWEIFHEIVSQGDTYVFDPHTPKEKLNEYWFSESMETFVAEDDGEIVGTYIIKPNQMDLGSHIANCSYMVHPKHQGKGIGKLLCEHSIRYARENGYLGIQFNFVVSTNVPAVRLWQKFGFKIIGTIPKAFRHKKLGFVDVYIMFKDLQSEK